MSALMQVYARGRATPSALGAGSIAALAGDGVVSISQVTPPSGGLAPYTRNLYRSTTESVKGSLLASDVSLPYGDDTVSNGTTYYYTLEVVDDLAASAETAQVSGTPAASSVLWATEWANSTGSTIAARTDGGRLDDLDFTDTILSVVTKASVGGLPEAWPDNLLRIDYDGTAAQLVGVVDQWAAPANGESIAFRFLAYNALANGGGVANEHGMQSNVGTGNPIQHCFQFFSPDSGGNGTLGFAGAGLPGNNFAEIPAGIPMRCEWKLTREGSGNSALLEIRIYDESISTTVPQWTGADFLGNWGAGPGSLDEYALPFVDVTDGYRSYTFGASGSSGGTGIGVYVTGFAVGSDWLGPYTGPEGS